MDHKVFKAPQRALASIVRNTRSNLQPILCNLSFPKLQHPALSHPAEEDCIHQSLDLSFQQATAVSQVDRQIIDSISRSRVQGVATS